MSWDLRARIKWATTAVDNFVEAMREQGIHIGVGTPPQCAVCDEPWPCAYERRKERP